MTPASAGRYLLDSDIVVWILRNRETVVARVRDVGPDQVVIASMTEAELRFGALKSRDPAATLARVEWFLSAPVAVLPFDRAAATHHARIRHELRRHPIGERDLIIASVAVANGLTLVSANAGEFRRVSGLVVENWAA